MLPHAQEAPGKHTRFQPLAQVEKAAHLQVVHLVLQDAGLPAVRRQAEGLPLRGEPRALHRCVALYQSLRSGRAGSGWVTGNLASIPSFLGGMRLGT